MPKKRENYGRVKVAINLINELRTRALTRKDIKNILNEEYTRHDLLRRGTNTISDKTLNRWMEYIEPIVYHDKGTKSYELNIDTVPSTVKEDELQVLHTTIQRISNNETARKLLEDLESKLTWRFKNAIKNKNPDPAVHLREINDSEMRITSEMVMIGPRARIDVDNFTKKILDDAILHSTKLAFSYHKYVITVHPMGIVYGPNNVYLVGFRENDDGTTDDTPHTYKLSDIREIHDTHRKFRKKPDFSIEQFANSMFGIYHDNAMYDVEWLVNKSVAREAKRYTFHPTQQIINNPDGSLTIKFRCGGLDAICGYMFQWNGMIKPVAPKKLVQKYRERLTRALQDLPDTAKK